MAQLSGAIAAIGGDIIALGVFYFDDDADHVGLVIKVCRVTMEALLEAMLTVDVEVVSVEAA